MSQFSTNVNVSLEKRINLQQPLNENRFENLENIYEINECVLWILTNHYQKVCLQFPDHLLPDSSQIASIFETKLQRPVYILADTNYESCCIDYVAATHINADAIIHYGPVCFSKTSATIPYLNIYEKHQIDIDVFYQYFIAETFMNCSEKPEILLDTNYICNKTNFCDRFPTISIKPIDCDLEFNGNRIIFIGNNCRKLLNLKFLNPEIQFYFYNPNNPKPLENYENNKNIMKRRYFLIEKIKDSQTIGIIIGTLGVRNYLEIIERIKQLLNLYQKKYYLISVGKPTVAKLANFPEIDVYVMITCSLNEIYDNRDFYKPIVTPYDIEIALNPTTTCTNFSYDFNHLISNPINDQQIIASKNQTETDISLITGQLRNNNCIIDDSNDDLNVEKNNRQLAIKTNGKLALNNTNYGYGYLNQRTWKGLEQNLGNNDVVLAEEGRCGIAQTYQNEHNTN